MKIWEDMLTGLGVYLVTTVGTWIKFAGDVKADMKNLASWQKEHGRTHDRLADYLGGTQVRITELEKESAAQLEFQRDVLRSLDRIERKIHG